MRKLFGLVLSVLLLVGCTATVNTRAGFTPVWSTPTPLISDTPTITDTLTPTLTYTLTPSPTLTPSLTLTPSMTTVPTKTVKPTCPNGNVWNITDFGADGSDSKDDYYAFLKAARCASGRKNITIYFPAGHYYIKEYKITGTTSDGRTQNNIANIMFSDCDGLKIIGAGKDNTVIDINGNFRMTKDQQLYDWNNNPYWMSYSHTVIPFFFIRCHNFYLGGLELDGNLDQTQVDPGLAGAGISFGVITSQSSNYTIANMDIHHFAEDGILLGSSSRPVISDRNVLIYNVNSHHNGRQGMSIIQVRGAAIIKSRFTDTGNGGGRWAPTCGVDIEPDFDKDDEVDVHQGDLLFIQNYFNNNRGGGVCYTPEVFHGGQKPYIVKPMRPMSFSGTLNVDYYPITSCPPFKYNYPEIQTVLSTTAAFYFSGDCDFNGDGAQEDIVSLKNTWLVKGTITIHLAANDIGTVRYFLDSNPVSDIIPADTDIKINTNSLINGRHLLSVIATDKSGQPVEFAQITLIVVNIP